MVNKKVVNLNANPTSDIDWSASISDAFGNIFTTGHDELSGNEIDLILTKHNSKGELVWEETFSNGSNSKNYGIALSQDLLGNIIVIGSTNSLQSSDQDFLLLKYTPNGSLIWNGTYNGPDDNEDIPVAVIVDEQNSFYVAGSSFSDATDYDYLVLKYNPNGSLDWESRYDYAGNIEYAVDIKFSTNDNIVVTGASATNTVNWEYATIKYDKIDGSTLEENRLSNGGVGLEIPKALVKDNNGNFYITGQSTINGLNMNVKTIKLSPDFNLVWQKTYDKQGLEDDSNDITIDEDGNVYVCGSTEGLAGGKSFLILKYDPNGVLLWEQAISDLKRPSSRTIAKFITIDLEGNIIATGESINGSNSFLYTIKLGSDGKRIWTKKQDITPDGIDTPLDLTVDINNHIIITGLHQTSASKKYSLIIFKEYKRPITIIYDDDGDLPSHRGGELIVRFASDAVNHDSINDLDVVYGRPEYFLNQETIDAINQRVDFDFRQAMLIRIFKKLKTTETHTTNRLGETIPIPDFWTSFIIVTPNETNLYDLHLDLQTLFPTVRYSHLNYFGHPHESTLDKPIEEEEEPLEKVSSILVTDEYYGTKQASLHTTPDFSNPNQHINIEPAWEIEKGKAFVRTGVFDDAPILDHEDLLYVANDESQSIIVDGWDFANEVSIYLDDDDYEYDPSGPSGHVLPVLGIIGAIDNNDKGIKGIAGGDHALFPDYEDRGASIYTLNWFELFGLEDEPLYSMEYVADAIVESNFDEPGVGYRYGLHLQNHSWGIQSGLAQWNDFNIYLLEDAVHFTNRMAVTFIVSRGNRSPPEPQDRINYPGCYHDDWIIGVGGSNSSGNWHNGAYSGCDLDLVAPFNWDLIYSLKNLNPLYANFSATSAAAPHVTGVAALMLSYKNTAAPNYNNLSPDDVENILQLTAEDVIFPPALPGEDYETGHGRLSACAAMHTLVDNEVLHFSNFIHNSGVTTTPPSAPIVALEPINLLGNASNVYGTSFEPGPYLAEIYKITSTVTHDLGGLPIHESWGRHSSSLTYDLPNGEDLEPAEKVHIESLTDTEAVLAGYVYRLVHPTTGEEMGWLPFHKDETGINAIMSYSVLAGTGTLIHGNEIGGPCQVDILIKANELVSSSNMKVIPNPASLSNVISISLEIAGSTTIELYDAKGSFLGLVFTGELQMGENEVENNISQLPTGIYCYKISTAKETASLRFVKQ